MYPRLRYAQEKIIFACKKKYFEKRLFDTKLDFHLIKKNKTFLGQFQKYLEKLLFRNQKNAIYSISIYGNCMRSIFSKKKQNIGFIITRPFY